MVGSFVAPVFTRVVYGECSGGCSCTTHEQVVIAERKRAIEERRIMQHCEEYYNREQEMVD